MEPDMQNGRFQPAASRNQLGGWLQVPLTPLEQQAQLLASRFCMSRHTARLIAERCFGEASND